MTATPKAPGAATADPNCIKCYGSGMEDSGGVYPWGDTCFVPCDCRSRAPEAIRALITTQEPTT